VQSVLYRRKFMISFPSFTSRGNLTAAFAGALVATGPTLAALYALTMPPGMPSSRSYTEATSFNNVREFAGPSDGGSSISTSATEGVTDVGADAVGSRRVPNGQRALLWLPSAGVQVLDDLPAINDPGQAAGHRHGATGYRAFGSSSRTDTQDLGNLPADAFNNPAASVNIAGQGVAIDSAVTEDGAVPWDAVAGLPNPGDFPGRADLNSAPGLNGQLTGDSSPGREDPPYLAGQGAQDLSAPVGGIRNDGFGKPAGQVSDSSSVGGNGHAPSSGALPPLLTPGVAPPAAASIAAPGAFALLVLGLLSIGAIRRKLTKPPVIGPFAVTL